MMNTYRIWNPGRRGTLLQLLFPVVLALIVVGCGLAPAPEPTATAPPDGSPQPSASASAAASDTRFLPTLQTVESLVRYQTQGKDAQEVPKTTSLKLNKGDAINVGTQGHASLRFRDAFKVEIFHDSQLVIHGDIAPDASAIEAFALKGGTAFTEVKRDKLANQRVRLTTEWAVIEDLGTEFVTYYDLPSQTTWVVVRRGLVQVSARDPNLPSVLVPAGKQTWVKPQQPPVPPVPAVRTAVGNLFPTLEQLTNGVVSEAAWLPSLSPFVPSRLVLPSGGTIQGTITLSGPAYEGGVPVTLVSTNSGVLDAPASIVVPEGAISQTFTMTATAVTQPTDVDLIAAYGDTQHTLTVTIQTPATSPSPQPGVSPPPSLAPALATLRLNPATIESGGLTTGTVTLTGPAPAEGVEISLISSDETLAAIAPTVTVSAGATSERFEIKAGNVRQDKQVTITVSDINGPPRRETLTILAPPTLSDFTVTPVEVPGGERAQGEIVLSRPAPAGGILVNLSSSSDLVTVPGQVTIDEGDDRAVFEIATRPAQQQYQATLTASYGPGKPTQVLTVTPPLPDLTVAIPADNPRQDCTKLVACFPMLAFTVTNLGSADVRRQFLAQVQIGKAEPQAVVIDGLAAGESLLRQVRFDTSGCQDTSCSVTVTVDPENTLEEADEDNNLASERFSGLQSSSEPEPSSTVGPDLTPGSTAEPVPVPN